MNRLKNILMLSCKKAAELIEKRLQSPLSTTESVQLSMHTKMCKACSEYEVQQKLIDEALTEDCKASANEAECEDLKTSILKKLKTENGK